MGKGDDPNTPCNNTAGGGDSGATLLVVRTPEQEQATRNGDRLGLIEYRLTDRSRSRSRRDVVDGRSMYERIVDDFGLLRQYEEVAASVFLHHPDERMRRRAQRLLNLCNQRMVKQAAYGWFKGYERYGFKLEDLIAEGNVGLAEAAEERDSKLAREQRKENAKAAAQGREPKQLTDADIKVFDPTKGNGKGKKANGNLSFMTYALPKVNMRIRRYIENNSERIYGARIPTEPFHEIRAVANVEAELVKEMGKGNVTAEMLADHPDLQDLGNKKKDGKTIKEISREERIERIEEARKRGQMRGESLNETLRAGDGDGDTERGHLIADNGLSTEVRGEDRVFVDRVREIMNSNLTAAEREVIGCIDLNEVLPEYAERAAASPNAFAAKMSMRPSRVRDVRRAGLTKLHAALASAGMVSDGMQLAV